VPRCLCALKLPATSDEEPLLTTVKFLGLCSCLQYPLLMLSIGKISLFCTVLYIHSDEIFVLVFKVTQITLISCYFKEIKV